MKHFKNLLFIVSAILICAVQQSCKDDDITPATGVIMEGGDKVTWGCACSDQTIDVNTELPWRIEVENGWVTPKQLTGKGAAKLDFYVEENNEDEDRTTTIKIIPEGGKVATITVVQHGLASSDENAIGEGVYKKHGVGWGYNGYGNYADDKYMTGQVLNEQNVKVIMKRYYGGNAGIEVEDYQTTETMETIGTSSSDLSNNLAINANLTLNIPCGFSLGLKASYDGKDLANESKNFSIKRYKGIILLKYLDAGNLLGLLTDNSISQATKDSILSTGFKGQLQKLKNAKYSQDALKKFVEIYGTHLISNAQIGGRFDYTMTTDKSNVSSSMDITAGLDMGYKKMFSIHGDAKYDESAKKIGSNYSCKVSVKGGSTTLLAGAASGQEGACKLEDIIKWAQSINEKNSLLIDFQLVPIWDIIPDDEAAGRVEAYLTGGEYVKANPNVELPIPKSDVSGAVMIPLADLNKELKENKTLVYYASAGSAPVVEICEELVKSLGTKRVTVAYPIISNRPDYSKGLFIGNGVQAPGYITWENNQYTYTKSEDFEPGDIIDVIYALGVDKELKLSGKQSSGVSKWFTAYPKPVYANYYRAPYYNDRFYTDTKDLLLKTYNIVKIGQHIWTRENINSPIGIGYAKMNYKTQGPAFYYTWNEKFISAQWCIPTTTCFKEMQSLTPTGAPFLKGGSAGLEIDALGYFEGSTYKNDNYYYLRSREVGNEGNITNNNTAIQLDIDGKHPINNITVPSGNYYPVHLVRTDVFEYE